MTNHWSLYPILHWYLLFLLSYSLFPHFSGYGIICQLSWIFILFLLAVQTFSGILCQMLPPSLSLNLPDYPDLFDWLLTWLTRVYILYMLLYMILTLPLSQYLCYLAVHTSYTLLGSKDSTWNRTVCSIVSYSTEYLPVHQDYYREYKETIWNENSRQNRADIVIPVY